ncbi:MAG: hypothetical protein GY838_09275 [bacterium]|nr:hypothetical protein [bacterium]
MDRDLDPRLEPLARRMRDRGQPPERDLWPGIDEAIDRRERAGDHPARTGWWRFAAAVAAMLVLVLGARDLHVPRGDSTPGGTPSPVVAEAAATWALDGLDEEAAIESALAELNAAMAADPDNPHLSRLALMVHRSRGEMLRRSGETAQRTG